MLQLDNRTPYAAERTIVMDKAGVKSWVVAVKATFDLGPTGVTRLADQQLPVLYNPEHFGEPGTSSIRYEADLIPSKGATDVLVNGHAHAPAGRPTSVVDVSLRTGPLHKRLRVFGDRYWTVGFPGLRASAPARFERMPITFERAFGGWDRTHPDPARQQLEPRNPIGSGFAIAERHLEGCALPNVEHPAQLVSSWSDRPAPAGLGAIASYWSPRLEWAGTYGDAWMKQKFPLLPDDFDERFHQCAPPDQQVAGCLRGGEEVALENLSESGSLRFALPRIYLAFLTRFGKERVEHRATLQTVVIEPDAARLVMLWQTSLACHHMLDLLDVTIVREKTYV